jgi:hypothetical protein
VCAENPALLALVFLTPPLPFFKAGRGWFSNPRLSCSRAPGTPEGLSKHACIRTKLSHFLRAAQRVQNPLLINGRKPINRLKELSLSRFSVFQRFASHRVLTGGGTPDPTEILKFVPMGLSKHA